MLTAILLAGTFEFIVPILGSSHSHDASHFTFASAFNPTPRVATVRPTGVFPFVVRPDCVIPEEWSIPPHSYADLALINCGPTAVTVAADEPIAVRNIIASFFLGSGEELQYVEAPTAWFESGESVVRATVEPSFGWRANLLLINPNDVPLRVDLHIERREAGKTRDESVEVAPRSSLLHPIAVLVVDPTGFPIVLTGTHSLRIRANGRYWAGVSNLNRRGSGSFEKAIALEP